MSLLDKASLVVTPNAYKASKLYSVVPNTTLGDMDVVRATTATRVNASGLIESVANNVPRLDYLNASCPSILVEPQRTNVQISSEDFSNGVYIKVGSTVTTNAIVAPDGNTTADKIVEDTSTGYHTVDILQPPVSAGVNTVSVFVKAAERTKFQIEGFYALTGNVTFDLTAGTATTTAPALNGKIENYGNGWFRCSATFTDLTGVNAQILFNILNNAGSNNYTGTSGSGLYLWGAQLELGTYSTSYIKTIASLVTRNADLISKTGISSLIGQTEGVLFVENAVLANDLTNRVISLSNGTTTNRIFINYSTTSNTITLSVVSSGTNILTISYVASDTTQFAKIAVRYSNTLGYSLWVNGVIRGSNVVTNIPISMDRLAYDNGTGINVFFSKTKQIQLYKTALSDTEMAQLTTI